MPVTITRKYVGVPLNYLSFPRGSWFLFAEDLYLVLRWSLDRSKVSVMNLATKTMMDLVSDPSKAYTPVSSTDITISAEVKI